MAGFRQMLNSSLGNHDFDLNQQAAIPPYARAPIYQQFYPPSQSPVGFNFVPSGLPPPGQPISYNSPGPSRVASEASTTAKNVSNRWTTPESKILIQTYKDNLDRLQKAKSSKGKKSVWNVLYQEFIGSCSDKKIKTTKTLAQVKEKWRALFEKYKAVSDNNKQTGRDRMDMEFFDEIDEFMGSSHQVNPQFTNETTISSSQLFPHGSESDEDVDSEKAEAEGKREGANNKKRGKEPAEKKKKQKIGEENESRLIELLASQQEALQHAQSQDEKAMESLLKFQSDSEKRHQEFMLAMFGKLGDMFSGKK